MGLEANSSKAHQSYSTGTRRSSERRPSASRLRDDIRSPCRCRSFRARMAFGSHYLALYRFAPNGVQRAIHYVIDVSYRRVLVLERPTFAPFAESTSLLSSEIREKSRCQ